MMIGITAREEDCMRTIWQRWTQWGWNTEKCLLGVAGAVKKFAHLLSFGLRVNNNSCQKPLLLKHTKPLIFIVDDPSSIPLPIHHIIWPLFCHALHSLRFHWKSQQKNTSQLFPVPVCSPSLRTFVDFFNQDNDNKLLELKKRFRGIWLIHFEFELIYKKFETNM
jgi:hypothetical protein